MAELSAFRFDPVNQCLWRRSGSGEAQIQLTPTEFGVLDHLVEHAGQLVTHRELLDAVWPGTAIEPQVVKNKIFHLRRVLEDDPKQPRYIETLPRRGYRFVGQLERSTARERVRESPATRLVGRDSVLAELWQALRKASTGLGSGRLHHRGTRHRQDGARGRVPAAGGCLPRVRIAHGQCVEGFGSKEAFFPVLEAVGRLCRGPDGARVVDTLATSAPTWLVQFPALLTRQHRETLRQEILGATRERMLREICDALAMLSARSPVLLVLDDLHWADSSTLDLISVLARHRGGLMLLGTYRLRKLAESSLPLDRLKRDLVARQSGREIVLQPLTEAEIAEYLAEGRVHGPPCRRSWRRCCIATPRVIRCS